MRFASLDELRAGVTVCEDTLEDLWYLHPSKKGTTWLLSESHDLNLALTVIYVPNLLSSQLGTFFKVQGQNLAPTSVTKIKEMRFASLDDLRAGVTLCEDTLEDLWYRSRVYLTFLN